MVFQFKSPVLFMIRSDFTSSGFLKSNLIPALVLITDHRSNYPAGHFQVFADKRVVSCLVSFPIDGQTADERAVKELLPQIVMKGVLNLPTYILFTTQGKHILDVGPQTSDQLETFVLEKLV